MKKLLLFFMAPLFSFGQIIGGVDYSNNNTSKNQLYNNLNKNALNCINPEILFETSSWLGMTFIEDDDDEYLWISNSSTIYKANLDGGILDSYSTSGSGGGMCFDGESVWRVHEQLGELKKMNLDGEVITSFILPYNFDDPNCWGVAWGNNFIWVSEYSEEITLIHQLNPANGEVINSFEIPYMILGLHFCDGYLLGTRKIFDGGMNNATGESMLYTIDVNAEEVVDSALWCIARPLGLTSIEGALLCGEATWSAVETVPPSIVKFDFMCAVGEEECPSDTIYINNIITEYDTIIQVETILHADTMIEYVEVVTFDTIVETEYIEVIITEYVDCDTGLPCPSGMAEIIEKSKTDSKIYNFLGQEIKIREGIYIENGEVKYRIN